MCWNNRLGLNSKVISSNLTDKKLLCAKITDSVRLNSGKFQNFHFWGKITKMITRLNSWIFSLRLDSSSRVASSNLTIFYLSLWFVFSVELTFIEFLEFSTFNLDFASSGMTNEEPVLVVVGFGGIGSGSFGRFSSSSTKFSSFSTIIKSKSTSGILKWPPYPVTWPWVTFD